MGVIFYFSSRVSVTVSEIFFIQFVFFKTLHILEYAVLYVLFYRSFRNTVKAPDWQQRINTILFAIVYGMTDEIHQVFVPTREGRMRDIAIDASGILLAAYYLWKLLPKAPRRLRSWAKKLQVI